MATSGVLVDAGPLVALLNQRDQHHAACLAESKRIRGPFYTCWPAVTEAAYLLRRNEPAVEKLLMRIRLSKFLILQLAAEDVKEISSILGRYSDQGLDFTDATLMHLAERDGIDTIFTVDRRHFSVYRDSRGQSLSLVPATL